MVLHDDDDEKKEEDDVMEEPTLNGAVLGKLGWCAPAGTHLWLRIVVNIIRSANWQRKIVLALELMAAASWHQMCVAQW